MPFLKSDVVSRCRHIFGEPDIVVFSPGRANIIGEHTDYTSGYVLPFATEQGLYLAAAKIPEKVCRVVSLDTNEESDLFPWSEDGFNLTGSGRFICNAWKELMPGLPEHGLVIVIGGNLPIGAGMSSSSALTCGVLFLLNEVFDLGFSRFSLMEMSVRAEHGSGVRGGMMDQYTIFFGRKNTALWLDCGLLTHEDIPVDTGSCGFFLINTKVSHELVNSPYNTRRNESEEALDIIRKREQNSVLQYKDLHQADKYSHVLESVLFKRAAHIISENQRVVSMIRALQQKNMAEAGRLLTSTHESLSRYYEVSCEELDFLVEKAREHAGWLGGRMMGGGFGGCTINLIDLDKAEEICAAISNDYYKTFGIVPEYFRVVPSEGLRRLSE